MKYIIITAVIALAVLDVLILYCALCMGAEEDRWLEKYIRKSNSKRKR